MSTLRSYFKFKEVLKKTSNQLLSPYTVALRQRDSRKLFYMYPMGQICKATPNFLFAINLIGFFYAECQTLSKIKRAVFCQ
jgi:hypothetical protein